MIKVPCGTIIKIKTGLIIADLVVDGQAVIAKAVAGVRKCSFCNSTKAGTELPKRHFGEERWIILELKLLADGVDRVSKRWKSTFCLRYHQPDQRLRTIILQHYHQTVLYQWVKAKVHGGYSGLLVLMRCWIRSRLFKACGKNPCLYM